MGCVLEQDWDSPAHIWPNQSMKECISGFWHSGGIKKNLEAASKLKHVGRKINRAENPGFPWSSEPDFCHKTSVNVAQGGKDGSRDNQ